MKLYPLALSVALAATFLCSSPAQAAESCATLSFPDESAQDVIIGEYAIVISDPFWGETLVRTGEVGVCWRDESGLWTLEQPTTIEFVDGVPSTVTCDTATSDTKMLFLDTGPGNDTVTTLLEVHTLSVGGPNWIRSEYTRDGTTRAMFCGANDRAIAPWNPDFEFGVRAVLGTGSDRFYGTPADDIAQSNHVSTSTVSIPPLGPGTLVQVAPGDNATDLLCGGDGDDELLGDADDGPSFEEILDGGKGDDFCDGDPHDAFSPLGGDVFDIAQHVFFSGRGCNTIERATTPLAFPSLTWPFVDCASLWNPITEFGLRP
ncbi:MAG: hypothetical protein JKY37_27600 [Nannocystaceae bacterium]|nr:hypothetical protein [Nannocystaceae bacterium]